MAGATDVEMMDATKNAAEGTTAGGIVSSEKSADAQYLDDLKQFFKMIERAVSQQDFQQMHRPVCAITHLRHRTNINVLLRVVHGLFQKQSDQQRYLDYLGDLTKTATTAAIAAPSSDKAKKAPLPEFDVYVHMLTLMFLIDERRTAQALQCADALMEKIGSIEHRRTIDSLAARFYYFYALAHEQAGGVQAMRRILLVRLRTATLRCDDEGQAYLINALLRSYVRDHLYTQADKLVSRLTFPENVHNNQLARYHFYLGRVKSTRLQYSEAFQHLQQATRKAPQVRGV